MKDNQGAEGQNGAFQVQSAPRGRGAVTYRETAPSAAPLHQREGQVRILLSEAASRALLDAGSCFIVAARATAPDDGSRIAVHFLPCSFERGNDAVRVAMGEKPLARVKSPRPAPSAPLTPQEIRKA